MRAEDRAALACRSTAARLHQAGVPTESLAAFVPAGRRLLVLPKPATMLPMSEVWRLGVLLLDTEGKLYALGRTTRAAERGRPGYQSVSREQRRELAAAALQGGYPIGATVNFDATALPLEAHAIDSLSADAPIGLADGEIRVRWRAGAPIEGAASLAAYLDERAALLIDPPLGAN